MTLINTFRFGMIAVATIIYVLFAVSFFKEKKNGNYLEALYDLGWTIIFYMAILHL